MIYSERNSEDLRHKVSRKRDDGSDSDGKGVCKILLSFKTFIIHLYLVDFQCIFFVLNSLIVKM